MIGRAVIAALVMTAAPKAFAADAIEPPVPVIAGSATAPAAATLAAAGGVLDQFAAEPSVREVQEIAMRYGLVSDDVINGYQKSAKWTKALPRTTVTYRDNLVDNNGVNVDNTG